MTSGLLTPPNGLQNKPSAALTLLHAATMSEETRYAGKRRSDFKGESATEQAFHKPVNGLLGSTAFIPSDDAESALQQRAEAERKASFDRGMAAGVELGQEKAMQELESRYQQSLQAAVSRERQLSDAVTTVSKLGDELTGVARQAALNLCVEALCRIFQRSVLDPNFVLAQVELALEEAQADPKLAIEVRMHPASLQVLKQATVNNSSFKLFDPSNQFITLKPDESLKSGGCVVTTPSGGIDARLSTLLAGLARTLSGAEVNNASA